MPTATIRAIKTTVRAQADLPGNVEVLEGGIPTLSFWAWEVQAMYAKDEGTSTSVSFKGETNWHMPIAAPLTEVRSAVVAAQAMWNRELVSQRESSRKALS